MIQRALIIIFLVGIILMPVSGLTSSLKNTVTQILGVATLVLVLTLPRNRSRHAGEEVYEDSEAQSPKPQEYV